MSIFKNLLAATAIVNVAFAGTAYSSDVASVVTSVQLVTSVTFVDPPAASSSTHCNTLTVTEVAPPSTVTIVAPPPGASGTDVLESSKSDGMTIQTSIPSSTISKVFGNEPCTHVTSGKAAIYLQVHRLTPHRFSQQRLASVASTLSRTVARILLSLPATYLQQV